MQTKINSGSFRDPSGFVFERNGVLFRQINVCYLHDFEALQQSGLLRLLHERGDLIPHEEVGLENAVSSEAYKIIKPERIPFVSYPYEWSFSHLKDAALLTLTIQRKALEHNLSLKDASAYNIQFANGKPIFIDTLSFERYTEGKPWVAYGQFCQHFLAPLTLMSNVDVRLSQLLRAHLDGIPLNLASRLLPLSTIFRPGMFFHIHLHAKSQQKYANKNNFPEKNLSIIKALPKITRTNLIGIIENLNKTIQNLRWKPAGTQWGDYYDATNYTPSAFSHKKNIVEIFLTTANPQTIWDLGANEGTFSRIASHTGARVISFDADAAAVEKNYLRCKTDAETRILPLLLDLTNPSPAIGWNNKERHSLVHRGPADLALVLALIHHLCIGNNLSFTMIAEFLSLVCTQLVIEFVPKNDSQVQRLLKTREDIYLWYNKEEFIKSFSNYFTIISEEPVIESNRIIFFMKKTQ
jgi:ribosomal protein L11 methylase PrmA